MTLTRAEVITYTVVVGVMMVMCLVLLLRVLDLDFRLREAQKRAAIADEREKYWRCYAQALTTYAAKLDERNRQLIREKAGKLESVIKCLPPGERVL